MNTSLNMQRMPIDQLKPAKYNPRKDLKPGDPAYEKIKRSLHDFGYVDPIVWNEVTGNIVGGHQRYKVLKAEGATEVDCVVVHIENPQDEKALNIALNKATGDWEPVALAELLQDLQLSGYDLGATGFDAAEVDDLFSKVHDKDVHDDDCELDPEEVTPYVQPGDIWTLGRHRMMCGDSTDSASVDTLMHGIKANLVVTDPPYNVAYESADGKSIQNDSMADEQFFAFLLAAFKNMAAHMAEGGSAYVFHADTEGLNFRRAFKESGFHISGVCIWVKNSLVLGRSPYQWQHEPVLYGWLPNGKHKWFSDRKQSTIWNFDKPKKSADHPTMKPIPLLCYPIKNSSAPNAVVMDAYQIKTGLSRAKISHLMDSETWMNALKAKEMGFCDEVLYTGAEDLPENMAGFAFERKPAAACLMNRVIASMPKPVNVVHDEPEHPPDAEQTPEEPKEPEPVTPDNRVKAADLEKRLSLLK